MSLPEIQFCDYDPSEVEANVIAGHEEAMVTYFVAEGYSEAKAAELAKLYPGDPARLWQEAAAYAISQLRYLINDAAKQNLLYFAREGKLDHLGALHGARGLRLEATAAQATQKFELDEALGFAVAIPVGTRVTPDGSLIFETTEAAEIAAGETEVSVTVECQTAGVQGNGFVAGQINRAVDEIENVTSTENTTTSLGGSDEEADDNYRARIQLAPESYSTAGPRGGYAFWAKSAHASIIDVSVTTPGLGIVKICPLCTDGDLPSSEVLDAVEEAVDGEERRPLTDDVVVAEPDQVSFTVDVDYWIETGSATLVAQIQEAVAEALAEYQTWQTTKLGRDINPSVCSAKIQAVSGVKRVVVNSPAFTAVDEDQVARLSGTATANYQGLEDE